MEQGIQNARRYLLTQTVWTSSERLVVEINILIALTWLIGQVSGTC
jgi:hypothetical protein